MEKLVFDNGSKAISPKSPSGAALGRMAVAKFTVSHVEFEFKALEFFVKPLKEKPWKAPRQASREASRQAPRQASRRA